MHGSFVHAGAIVFDLQIDVSSGLGLTHGSGGLFADFLHPGAHDHGSITLSNGFRAVDHKVDDELLDLRVISVYRGQAFPKLKIQADILRNRRSKESGDLPSGCRHVDRLYEKLSLT